MLEIVKPEHNLATILAKSNGQKVILADLPQELLPQDEEQAYAIQREILAIRNVKIGGWKVGAQSMDAPIRYSPLPSDCVYKSPATFALDPFARNGLELEIAFCFGKGFEPAETAYSDEEIWAGVKYMAAAIEVIASRFKEWPEVETFTQLADFQNNDALVFGSFVPYKDTYPFLSPELSFSFGGTSIVKQPPSNPAGDPRRLLPWLVNQCILKGEKFRQGTIVTTGTYTGVYFPSKPGIAIGLIDGLPPVRLILE